MQILELSTCFVTPEVAACRACYETYFRARAIFDCGWYVNLRLGSTGPSIQFMQPQEGQVSFAGGGVMLNCRVDDVDAEHARLIAAGLQPVMALADHSWGDRGFAVLDPIGNTVYVYADREPDEAFKQYYKD